MTDPDGTHGETEHASHNGRWSTVGPAAVWQQADEEIGPTARAAAEAIGAAGRAAAEAIDAAARAAADAVGVPLGEALVHLTAGTNGTRAQGVFAAHSADTPRSEATSEEREPRAGSTVTPGRQLVHAFHSEGGLEEVDELPPVVGFRWIGPIAAALREPLITVVPVIALLLPSLAFGLFGKATYTAESRVLVGRLDVESSAVPGYAQASIDLASTYARLVSGNGVDDRVAARLHLPVSSVKGRLSGSPIPESPIVRIDAKSGSQSRADALDRAATSALVSYVADIGSDATRSADLLNRYNAANTQLTRDQQAVDTAQAALNAAVGPNGSRGAGATAIANAQSTLTAAQSQLDADKLQVQTLATQYADSQRGVADSGVTVVQSTHSLGSNRKTMLELAVAGAVLVGLLVGLCLVTMLENWPAIRDLRRAILIHVESR